MRIDHYFHEVLNPDVMPMLRLIVNNQRKIMANAAKLAAKVDELQAAIDSEQAQIADALATLQSTIDGLKAEIIEGGTVGERQAIADKLDAAVADVSSTIADAAPAPPEEPTDEEPVEG